VTASPRRERKNVTVLFADLVGFTARAETLDPEDVEAILRPYHERLRVELEQRGGTVEKFIGDAVMAVFGAPITHEDDPERAVRAALAIRDGIVDDGRLEVRVAVNTGEALVRVDARPESGEGMVSGDVVNTAARLQTAAPVNGILVGESTYRATQHLIDYREHEAVEAKGKAEPLPVWEAVEARARVGVELEAPSTPLVGRERERELLVGAFARVRSDAATQLVTIVGVPGIGKSRLVAELFAELEREAELTNWRHGRSLPYGEGVPYWAFADIVKAQAGILESDAAGEADRKLHAAVAALIPDSDASWVESRLRPLVGLETAAGGRDENYAAWRRFVEAIAEQRPTVLVFEDLHWAGGHLLDFVDQLVDWLTDVPLLVVATARPELLDRRPGWGGGKRNALTVSLAPLGDDETARLIGAVLDRHVLPADVQQALIARAGGNPLYAEQFARMLDERGDAAGVPETVQGIIAARIDSLPPREKQLLVDAAVLGKRFWRGALGAIAGADGDEVDAALRALQRKEFVRRERRSTVAGETELAFAHLLVRDVAYSQIPRADRAQRHLQAARWLESLAADRSEDVSELLVHHYLAALELSRAAGRDVTELVEPAVAALLDATERALRLFAFGPAERYATAALELLPTEDPRTPRAQLALAAAEFDLGRGDAFGRGTEAAARFRELGDVESAAEAEAAIGSWLWQAGRVVEAQAASERALAVLADAEPSRAKAAVLVEQSRQLMLAGRTEEAIEIGTAGLEVAEWCADEQLQARVLTTIGTARTMLDADGVPELERAIEIAERIGDILEYQRGTNNLAEEVVAQGRLAEAEAMYARLAERLERAGYVQGLAWMYSAYAELTYELGDWTRADSFVAKFQRVFDQLAGHYLEFEARHVQARLAYARGDREASERLWARAVTLARQMGDPQAAGPVLSGRALALLELGRRDEAEAATDEVLALHDEQGRALSYRFLLYLGWLVHDFGRAGEYPRPGRGKVWYEAGALIARGALGEAADLFGDMGMRTDEAYARLRIAESLATEGRRAEAQPQLERALAFYRSVGATTYVRRGEAILPASA
jgi:class 3 adenylate cyclase/tetratricopeptide (TPR) repeat protein